MWEPTHPTPSPCPLSFITTTWQSQAHCQGPGADCFICDTGTTQGPGRAQRRMRPAGRLPLPGRPRPSRPSHRDASFGHRSNAPRGQRPAPRSHPRRPTVLTPPSSPRSLHTRRTRRPIWQLLLQTRPQRPIPRAACNRSRAASKHRGRGETGHPARANAAPRASTGVTRGGAGAESDGGGAGGAGPARGWAGGRPPGTSGGGGPRFLNVFCGPRSPGRALGFLILETRCDPGPHTHGHTRTLTLTSESRALSGHACQRWDVSGEGPREPAGQDVCLREAWLSWMSFRATCAPTHVTSKCHLQMQGQPGSPSEH